MFDSEDEGDTVEYADSRKKVTKISATNDEENEKKSVDRSRNNRSRAPKFNISSVQQQNNKQQQQKRMDQMVSSTAISMFHRNDDGDDDREGGGGGYEVPPLIPTTDALNTTTSMNMTNHNNVNNQTEHMFANCNTVTTSSNSLPSRTRSHNERPRIHTHRQTQRHLQGNIPTHLLAPTSVSRSMSPRSTRNNNIYSQMNVDAEGVSRPTHWGKTLNSRKNKQTIRAKSKAIQRKSVSKRSANIVDTESNANAGRAATSASVSTSASTSASKATSISTRSNQRGQPVSFVPTFLRTNKRAANELKEERHDREVIEDKLIEEHRQAIRTPSKQRATQQQQTYDDTTATSPLQMISASTTAPTSADVEDSNSRGRDTNYQLVSATRSRSRSRSRSPPPQQGRPKQSSPTSAVKKRRKQARTEFEKHAFKVERVEDSHETSLVNLEDEQLRQVLTRDPSDCRRTSHHYTDITVMEEIRWEGVGSSTASARDFRVFKAYVHSVGDVSDLTLHARSTATISGTSTTASTVNMDDTNINASFISLKPRTGFVRVIFKPDSFRLHLQVPVAMSRNVQLRLFDAHLLPPVASAVAGLGNYPVQLYMRHPHLWEHLPLLITTALCTPLPMGVDLGDVPPLPVSTTSSLSITYNINGNNIADKVTGDHGAVDIHRGVIEETSQEALFMRA